MATQSQKPTGGDDGSQTDQDGEQGTFKTDVSETDDEGTTVREADVRESDLSETDSPKSGNADADDKA